jgi:hypothetical protein
MEWLWRQSNIPKIMSSILRASVYWLIQLALLSWKVPVLNTTKTIMPKVLPFQNPRHSQIVDAVAIATAVVAATVKTVTLLEQDPGSSPGFFFIPKP